VKTPYHDVTDAWPDAQDQERPEGLDHVRDALSPGSGQSPQGPDLPQLLRRDHGRPLHQPATAGRV